MLYLALAQLTDEIDPMYIIAKVLSEPYNGAHVICFFGSSTAHRQDGPHVYYIKMTGYLDIDYFFFFRPLSCQLMAAMLDFSI